MHLGTPHRFTRPARPPLGFEARAFRAEPGLADSSDASSVPLLDGDGQVVVVVAVAVVVGLVVRGRRGGVAAGGAV